MTTYFITQAELLTALYCLESMQVDFKKGDPSFDDFSSLFEKFEALADLTPDPSNLDLPVAHLSLISS
jgi:hypothetical protein|tara:strand:- start:251 stop:454 length:204 start_codon:yes stop_codon:yes gene_type:complete